MNAEIALEKSLEAQDRYTKAFIQCIWEDIDKAVSVGLTASISRPTCLFKKSEVETVFSREGFSVG